jgi:hypothetical protein
MSVDPFFFQFWPLAIGLVVLGFLVRRGNRKRYQEQVDRNTTNASLHGMAYSAPTGDDVGGQLRGTHHFDGTTRGVKWSLETLYLTDQDTGGYSQTRNYIQNYTRWTAPHVVTGGGALLLMSLPKGVQSPAVDSDNSGFLSAIKNKAAAIAFQVFTRLTFGNARSNVLPLEPEHRLALSTDAFGTAFVAFSNRPQLMERISPSVRESLLEGIDKRVAFLWDEQGLTLTWPTAHMSPEEVSARADYGTAIAEMLIFH